MFVLTQDANDNKQSFNHVSSFYQRGDVLELNFNHPTQGNIEQDIEGGEVVLCEEDQTPDEDDSVEGHQVRVTFAEPINTDGYETTTITGTVEHVNDDGSFYVDVPEVSGDYLVSPRAGTVYHRGTEKELVSHEATA